MAGASAARVPGLVAAAAALATAATIADIPDLLHPVVSPIMFYAANRCSRAASGPRCLTPSSRFLSGDMWSPASLPLAQGVAGGTSVVPSLYSTVTVLPNYTQGPASTSAIDGPVCRERVCHCLGQSNLSSASIFSPSYFYSARQLPADELQRPIKVQSVKSMSVSSSFAALSSSKVVPSSPVTFPWFPSLDLSSRVATILSSFSPVQSPIIAWKSLHTWHTPTPLSLLNSEEENLITKKPVLTVVLLGWLGSEQKHLKKYADWYNARGIHAVTFTIPMADIVNFSMGGRAEEHVERLTEHLSKWLAEDGSREKHVIFHTFSNTGWLTYGVLLENLSWKGNKWVDRIKGCVVDSAPAADNDPRVWASGFSAALLKKRSSASNGEVVRDPVIPDSRAAVLQPSQAHIAESALVAFLEKFFAFFLQIPAISERLNRVVAVLSKQQPPCPQLYIYSTADKVIPVNLVESFMEKQRKEGRIVRGCNFQSSPHVDHFRTFPDVYGKQVSTFLEECLYKTTVR